MASDDIEFWYWATGMFGLWLTLLGAAFASSEGPAVMIMALPFWVAHGYLLARVD